MTASVTRVLLRVAPGARRSGIVRHGQAWKVAVAAAPERGAANAAVLTLLAEALGVPHRRLRLVSGRAARDKIVEVEGITPEASDAALAAASGERVGSRHTDLRFPPGRARPSPNEMPRRRPGAKGATPMSTIDTSRFRRALEEERERIVDALESIHKEDHRLLEEQSGDEAQYDNHPADVATITFERELDYTLEGNSEQVLAAIDAALRRIEDGTYGTCVRCGRPIGEERLEAMPWTPLCIDDAREVERR